MHIYKGLRNETGVHVTVNNRPLRHVSWHSPTGFEWGYGGSGPADLALSILVHYFNERYLNTQYIKKHDTQRSKAWKYHQAFKWTFFANEKAKSWMIRSDDITHWLKREEQPQALTA